VSSLLGVRPLLTIHNLNGKQLFEKENFTLDNNPHKISIDKLKTGIYILSIRFKDEIQSFKLVKIE